LRANTLGDINRAPGLTLFLRSGMSGWLRAIAGQKSVKRKMYPKTTPIMTKPDVGVLGEDLVAILTDAILNQRPDSVEVTHERTNAVTP
jgi:hypothetical protein